MERTVIETGIDQHDDSIFELTKNMRLTKSSSMSVNELHDQTLYASILKDIGNHESKHIDAFQDENCSDDEQIYKLKCSKKYVIDDLQL